MSNVWRKDEMSPATAAEWRKRANARVVAGNNVEEAREEYFRTERAWHAAGAQFGAASAQFEDAYKRERQAAYALRGLEHAISFCQTWPELVSDLRAGNITPALVAACGEPRYGLLRLLGPAEYGWTEWAESVREALPFVDQETDDDE